MRYQPMPPVELPTSESEEEASEPPVQASTSESQEEGPETPSQAPTSPSDLLDSSEIFELHGESRGFFELPGEEIEDERASVSSRSSSSIRRSMVSDYMHYLYGGARSDGFF